MLSVERIERSGESVILYDASRLQHAPATWFDRAQGPAPRATGGRGATLFIRCDGEDGVLKHYHRGGAVARIAGDRFLFTGTERARSFVEWRLLARIRQAGLPAPRPLAARFVRHGLFYRADLITARIPGVTPLSAWLAQAGGDDSVWARVGACVARFHRAGFCHADLNAHNIMVDGGGGIFLLDFDRGSFRPRPGAWQERNLARLHRSLGKISREGRVRFDAARWAALLAGYAAST